MLDAADVAAGSAESAECEMRDETDSEALRVLYYLYSGTLIIDARQIQSTERLHVPHMLAYSVFKCAV